MAKLFLCLSVLMLGSFIHALVVLYIPADPDPADQRRRVMLLLLFTAISAAIYLTLGRKGDQ